MAIIIGDIHGDIKKARAFLEYKPEVEHVALGDLVDSRDKSVTLADELACLDLLFESPTVLIWGNHDLAYTEERPWRGFSRYILADDEVQQYVNQSEYLMKSYRENGDLYARNVLTERYSLHRDRFRAAYATDGWLCMHAGVSPGLAKIVPEEALKSGSSAIAEWLNEEFQREFQVPVYHTCAGWKQRYGKGPLFNIHYCRGGLDKFGGIFWYDAIYEETTPSSSVGKQLFGHTPIWEPEVGPSWINLNAEDGTWVFDTETERLIEIGRGK